MTNEEFEVLVAAGIDKLPTHVRERMENVAVTIADEPSEAERRENGLHDDETLFGLYHGVPQTERGVSYMALPDKITIYKNPILESCKTAEEIKRCVTNTVWHEVAHHFGMDERMVREEEHRRGREL